MHFGLRSLENGFQKLQRVISRGDRPKFYLHSNSDSKKCLIKCECDLNLKCLFGKNSKRIKNCRDLSCAIRRWPDQKSMDGLHWRLFKSGRSYGPGGYVVWPTNKLIGSLNKQHRVWEIKSMHLSDNHNLILFTQKVWKKMINRTRCSFLVNYEVL